MAATFVALTAAALAVGVPALTTAVAATAPTTTTSAPPTTSATDPAAWPVYHHDVAGSGVAAPVSGVTTTAPAWRSPVLDGQLYGEPLVVGGRVFVATEDDTVEALSATTGTVLWSDHVGTPVPSGSLPCGDITPTVGVTGTPVVDPARDEVFVVADEDVHGSPAHVLVGLDTTTGRTVATRDVDPSGSDPAALLQRTGLTLDAGQVVFGFGGNYGDCSTYRGWVVAVPESGGTPADFAVDSAPGESQGAVWMGGAAPTVDASGDVWAAAGNGSVTSDAHAYDDSDSVLQLSPAMRLLQFFAPTSWASDNRDDLDLSMAPALLANGQVVEAGKARTAYLLDGAHLGGIGGQRAAVATGCDDDVDGGAAVVGSTVYLPCLSGVVAVTADASPAALHVVWASHVGGGPPIVAGGLVWTIGQDGTLDGLDPATGAVRQQASVGAPANHFPTPAVGDGVLLAPAADRVVAFAAPSTSTPAPTTVAPSTTAPSTTLPPGVGVPARRGPGLPLAAKILIFTAIGLVVAAAAWTLGSRRGRGDPPPG